MTPLGEFISGVVIITGVYSMTLESKLILVGWAVFAIIVLICTWWFEGGDD